MTAADEIDEGLHVLVFSAGTVASGCASRSRRHPAAAVIVAPVGAR